jgi:hypothetical protein
MLCRRMLWMLGEMLVEVKHETNGGWPHKVNNNTAKLRIQKCSPNDTVSYEWQLSLLNVVRTEK